MTSIPDLLAIDAYFGKMKESSYDGTRHSQSAMTNQLSLDIKRFYLSSFPPAITLRIADELESNGLTYAQLQSGPAYMDPTRHEFRERSIYVAVPYNRVVNVWWKKFGTSQAQESGEVVRFDMNCSARDGYEPSFFRIGWATEKAIQELNAHPFYYVGDVPGSFSFSTSESAMFKEGRCLPFMTNSGDVLSMAPYAYALSFNPNNRSIQMWGSWGSNLTIIDELNLSMSLPSVDALPEELFPVISCGTWTSFNLKRTPASNL